jgi:uncharacterized protein YbaR (Trm112 family)
MPPPWRPCTNMIRPELFSILCCPLTRQELKLADHATIAALNKRITAGEVKNRAGEVVTEPIEEGLITADQKWIYPVRNNIPVLLIAEAIPN